MANLQRLVPMVASHMSNVPEPQILKSLSMAAKQFCQDSRVWRISLGTVLMDPRQRKFVFNVPNERFRGAFLSSSTYETGDIILFDGGYHAATASGVTQNPDDAEDSWEDTRRPLQIPTGSYLNQIHRIVRLENANDPVEMEVDRQYMEYDHVTKEMSVNARAITASGYEYEVYGVLEPVFGSTEVPDFLLELHNEALQFYSVYEIMSSSDKAWSNPTLGQLFKRRYERRVAEATVADARRNTSRPLELRPIPLN